jgi:hypothetical protein
MGCEKYDEVSVPRFTGGKWIFTDYDIVVISSISNISIVKNDTICINSFNNQSFVSGHILMKQNFNVTALDRRFVRNKTVWEFDDNNRYLYCDFTNINGSLRPTHDPFWVNVNENRNLLNVINQTNGGSTTYTYESNAIGVMPPNVLTLVSPIISTDLYLSDGTRSKAVDIKVVLRFMR